MLIPILLLFIMPQSPVKTVYSCGWIDKAPDGYSMDDARCADGVWQFKHEEESEYPHE